MEGNSMYKDIELGFYLPSFFFLRINTKQNIQDIMKSTSINHSIFIHEYIHFLQDLMTTAGYRRIVRTVDLLKTKTRAIYFSNNQSFKLPFIIPSDSRTAKLEDFESIFIGEDEINFDFDSIISFDIEENGIVEGFEKEKIIKINTEDSKTKKRETFQFGTFCINESMAYLIESKFNNNLCPPIFPYRIVEMLIKKEFPEIMFQIKDLVFLCEVALNGHNPPLFILELLTVLKSKKQNLSKSNLVEILNESIFLKDNGEKLKIDDWFEYNQRKARKSLKDLFTSQSNYQVSHDWIDYTFDNVRVIKAAGFSFDCLAGGNYQEFFGTIFNIIGTPLMSNIEEKEYLGSHPKTKFINQLALFRGIFEIHMVLKTGIPKCTMKTYCRYHPAGDLTSAVCDEKPWENVNHRTGLLCPFAQLWKLWGLNEKTPLLN